MGRVLHTIGLNVSVITQCVCVRVRACVRVCVRVRVRVSVRECVCVCVWVCGVVSEDSPSFHLTESLTAPSITPSDVFSSTKGPALNDNICPHTHKPLSHDTHKEKTRCHHTHIYKHGHTPTSSWWCETLRSCSCYDACILMYGRTPPPPSLNSHSAVAITMSSFHGNIPANTDGRPKRSLTGLWPFTF